MSTLTPQQDKALERIIETATSTYEFTGQRWEIQIHYYEETRPGRGHDIGYTIHDGEQLLNGNMDPYGSGQWAIATVDWIHATAWEECECHPCTAERAAEDEDEAAPHEATPALAAPGHAPGGLVESVLGDEARVPSDANRTGDAQTPTGGARGPQNGTQPRISTPTLTAHQEGTR